MLSKNLSRQSLIRELRKVSEQCRNQVVVFDISRRVEGVAWGSDARFDHVCPALRKANALWAVAGTARGHVLLQHKLGVRERARIMGITSLCGLEPMNDTEALQAIGNSYGPVIAGKFAAKFFMCALEAGEQFENRVPPADPHSLVFKRWHGAPCLPDPFDEARWQPTIGTFFRQVRPRLA